MKNIVQLIENEIDVTDTNNVDFSGNIEDKGDMLCSTKESQKFPNNHEERRHLGVTISKSENAFNMKKMWTS